MIGSWSDVKRGMRTVEGSRFYGWKELWNRHPGGIRVLVVVKKSCNGDGAKGDRKVEA